LDLFFAFTFLICVLCGSRLLFGLGDGALVVLQGAIVARWFKQGGLVSTAYGATLLVSRLSSFTGVAAPAFFAEHVGLVSAMWMSVIVCFISLIASVLYAFAEARQETRLIENGLTANLTFASVCSGFVSTLRRLDTDFWCIAAVWSVLASTIFTLIHYAADIAATELNIPHGAASAGLASGSILLFAGLSSPLVGGMQDAYGKRSHLLAGSLLLSTAGMLLCAAGVYVSSTLFAAFGLVLAALAFAIAPVTLLSCVALVVESSVMPAALGIYKATQNLVLSMTHVAAGALRDSTGNYVATLSLLALLAASGLVPVWIAASGKSGTKLSVAALAGGNNFVDGHREKDAMDEK
jgi:MFS family permease